MRLVLLGPPGAGKGTQAKRIVSAHNVLHLSTGDMLRAAALTGTTFGKEVKRTMASGRLVPDQLIITTVIDRISQMGTRIGFVLDGFPRTMSQALRLDEHLEDRDIQLDHVIELRVDEEMLLERIATRAQQTKEASGEVRADDNREALRIRLDAYNEQTAPLIEYYRSRKILRTVDGLQAIDDVTSDIFRAIG